MSSSTFTAASRSSNSEATRPESRSRPSESWVRSFEPIEKPSKCLRKSSASSAFDGISHIMISLRSFSPRLRPCSASSCSTAAPSPTVRTKGTISCTLVRPISLRTLRIASHSISKQSRKVEAM